MNTRNIRYLILLLPFNILSMDEAKVKTPVNPSSLFDQSYKVVINTLEKIVNESGTEKPSRSEFDFSSNASEIPAIQKYFNNIPADLITKIVLELYLTNDKFSLAQKVIIARAVYNLLLARFLDISLEELRKRQTSSPQELFSEGLKLIHTDSDLKALVGLNNIILSYRNLVDPSAKMSLLTNPIIKRTIKIDPNNEIIEEVPLLNAILASSPDEYNELALKIIELGGDINMVDNNGNTPLHNAAQNLNMFMAKKLIEHGANTVATNKFGQTPLDTVLMLRIASAQNMPPEQREFIHQKQEAMFKLLLDQEKHIDTNRMQNLISTISKLPTQANIIRLLIQKIARQNKVDYDTAAKQFFETKIRNLTPLILACLEKYNDETIRAFIDLGANVNDTDSLGRTALHLSSQYTRSNIMEMLLNAGANINAKDVDGATPILYAILANLTSTSFIPTESDAQKQKEAITLLLDRGADVTIQPHSEGYANKSLLQIAQEQGNIDPEIITLLENAEQKQK